jgi:hypothetical protein
VVGEKPLVASGFSPGIDEASTIVEFPPPDRGHHAVIGGRFYD